MPDQRLEYSVGVCVTEDVKDLESLAATIFTDSEATLLALREATVVASGCPPAP